MDGKESARLAATMNRSDRPTSATGSGSGVHVADLEVSQVAPAMSLAYSAAATDAPPQPTFTNSSGILRVDLQDAPALDWTEVLTPIPGPGASGYPVGPNITGDPDIAGDLAPYQGSLKYPTRVGFRKEKSQSVLTNHFDLQIDPNTVFYEYKVIGMPEKVSKAVKRLYLETAIEHVPELKNSKASFATDKIDTIVAWVPLHERLGYLQLYEQQTWRLLEVANRDTLAILDIQFIRKVDLQGLRAFSSVVHPDPNAYDPEPTLNALNILITKCFDSNSRQLLYLNAHKFYIKGCYKDLYPVLRMNKQANGKSTPVYGSGAALRALRGYSYRVTAGMDKILLNVNATTSAFWKPLRLNVALEADPLRTFQEGQNALKGVRVWIDYNRGKDSDQTSNINRQHSRIKTIRGFGEPVNVQTFKLDHKDDQGNIVWTEDKSVGTYLEESKSIV
jgi:eukaryotic translation initiation factor 2C